MLSKSVMLSNWWSRSGFVDRGAGFVDRSPLVKGTLSIRNFSPENMSHETPFEGPLLSCRNFLDPESFSYCRQSRSIEKRTVYNYEWRITGKFTGEGALPHSTNAESRLACRRSLVPRTARPAASEWPSNCTSAHSHSPLFCGTQASAPKTFCFPVGHITQGFFDHVPHPSQCADDAAF